MMDKRKIYKKLMVIGRATGCHQLPERSFSFRGKQFSGMRKMYGGVYRRSFGNLLIQGRRDFQYNCGRVFSDHVCRLVRTI